MYTIVVGVDGSDAAAAALSWALDDAAARGDARVVAVLAYTYLDQHHLADEPDFDPGYSQRDAQRVLDTFVDGVLADRPGGAGAVELERRAVLELPPRALLSAADGADLLVVGSRGRGGFKGLLLGSVSQQVAAHAPCPVVIHRDPDAAG